jgi:hypothetical protein
MPNGVYPVPKFRFHDNRRTASEPASPWLKVRVLTHRDTLDRQLAQGVDPVTSKALALRAEQLVGRRERLATRVDGVVEAAAKPTFPFTAVVPVRRAEVRDCADDLVALARRLSDARPIDVQGVAMASILLSDGASPLYAGDRSLRHAVRAARLALDPVGAQVEELLVAAA